MAYQVDKYNGTFLVSVEDGTIDTTTDIKLVGRNYSGYGEVQNENFLHLNQKSQFKDKFGLIQTIKN
jgi:hypothetical protein